MSSLLQATLGVLAGVLVVLGIVAAFFHSLNKDDLLVEFRKRNLKLVQDRFGEQISKKRASTQASPVWHKRLHTEETNKVLAGQGVLIGLSEVLLLEDQSGVHWRVKVTSQSIAPSTLEVLELGERRGVPDMTLSPDL